MDFRYGDIEITIEAYGDELDVVIRKDGHVYIYPADEINEELDNMIPGWFSIYSQEEIIDYGAYYL